MKKYTPLQSVENIEIAQQTQAISLTSEKKIISDPKNQLSPRVYKVIRNEKRIKAFMLLTHSIIFFASVIMFIIAYFKVGVFIHVNLGYLILFGAIMFISFAFMLKNTIEVIQWKHTINKFRNSTLNGDYTSSNMFHLTYRKIILKDVNLTWLLIFVLTYMALITAIIYGLYLSNEWVYDSEALKINFAWAKWLDNSFGNTSVFCLISVIIMAALVGSYIFIRLFDKKRLADIDDFLGEKSLEIHQQIEEAKKTRNKMLLRLYIVIVVLTILLPLALICYALWRTIRRKKS